MRMMKAVQKIKSVVQKNKNEAKYLGEIKYLNRQNVYCLSNFFGILVGN